ncbi:MAG: membrane protein insertase YidC [bacterium]|nr:membrane protein insertase YidC [bacterium]
MDRNTKLAFGLILLLMVGYFLFMSKFAPVPEATAPDSTTHALDDRVDVQNRTVPIDTGEQVERAAESAVVGVDFGEAPERELIVETDVARYYLSSQGAVINRIELLEFAGTDTEFVQIVGPGKSGEVVSALEIDMILPGGRVNSREWNFSVSGDQGMDFIKVGSGESFTLSFRTADGRGGELIKSYAFRGDEYEFLLNLGSTLSGSLEGTQKVGINWMQGILQTEKNRTDELRSFNNFYQIGEDQEKKSLRNFKDGQGLIERGVVSEEGTIQWVASRGKYFVAALIPSETLTGRAVLVGDNENEYLGWRAEYPMRGGRNTFNEEFKVYVGPLHYKDLEAYDRGLEDLVDMGKLIRPISLALRWVMDFLHRFIPNYGIIIILMSILTKVLFFRLSNKSFTSMKEMQAIQPQLKEIQEKYKSDNQRVQKETMALYKEHGVNPLGGCLPLLFQMPVFFALYRVLRSAVELRGAGFVFWINDLSNMDVIYHFPKEIPLIGGFIDNSICILPILMGISMWAQQKFGGTGMGMSSSSTASQTQNQMAAMNKVMPFFMTFIFYRMPSGLVLYWLVNNILTAVQQYYIHKGLNKSEPNVVSAS